MNNYLSTKTKAQVSPSMPSRLPLSKVAEKRQTKHTSNSRGVTHALMVHLEQYAKHEVVVEDVTPQFCTRFAKFLLRQVDVESARTYLQKMHAILAVCERSNYLQHNPMPDLRDLLPRREWHERTFLGADELWQLSHACCPSPLTKQAFLFACYTGLRLSDIETLRWDEIRHEPTGPTIVKRQCKTRREVRVPLCQQALSLLDSLPRNKRKQVFEMRSRSSIGNDLKAWAKEAGIRKPLTFHVSRHTFASMLVSSGVDLHTISRLCGHSNIRTTEIYTHASDIRLKEGVKNIERMLANVACNEKNNTPLHLYNVAVQRDITI